MSRLPLLPFLALAILVACGGNGGGGIGEMAGLPSIVFTNDSGEPVAVKVEVPSTQEGLIQGLMFRQRLPEDQGMLFDFGFETRAPFWMKDTLIPLSIAFISGQGEILEIQDMEPLSLELHQPSQNYRYALEVNQGWFQRHGLGPGSRAALPLPTSRLGSDEGN